MSDPHAHPAATHEHDHAADHTHLHHEGHGAQDGAASGHSGHHADASWRGAALATAHCLTGCAIGEVLGMVIGTATGLSNPATIALSIVLAFVFGYGLTMRGVLAAGVPLRTAAKVALAADTVSIAVMELVDNTVIVAIPGAMNAGLTSPLFWGALALSLAVAFVVTTPVNRLMINRGLGHAVVHGYHQH